MIPNLSIDHIAIAVLSIDEARGFYEALGFTEIRIEDVPSEKVRVGFIEFKNGVHIELLESTDVNGPIAKFIAKRGPGIHHICIRTNDMSKDLKTLADSKFRLIDSVPKKGANNCWVAFVHPTSAGGVLFELSQKGSVDIDGI